MNLSKLHEHLENSLYGDKELLDEYVSEMVREFPDEKVSEDAKVGNYKVPWKDGPTTQENKRTWDNNLHAWVDASLTWVQNFVFFDIIKLTNVYDGRLSGESTRWGTWLSLGSNSSKEVLSKSICGYISGFWTFKKQGNRYTLVYLGLRPTNRGEND